MKKYLSFFLFVLLLGLPGQAATQSLFGRWLYVGFSYQGQIYPPLDSDLILHFEFTEDGLSHLEWSWTNSLMNCSRRAVYAHDKNIIDQWVVWSDPQNTSTCNKDPDMKVGSRSQTPYSLKDNSLYLELSLDGNPLFYILKKVAD